MERDLGVLVSGKLNVSVLAARGDILVLGTPGPTWPVGAGRGLSSSALLWGGLTSAAGGSLGHHNLRKTLNTGELPKGTSRDGAAAASLGNLCQGLFPPQGTVPSQYGTGEFTMAMVLFPPCLTLLEMRMSLREKNCPE